MVTYLRKGARIVGCVDLCIDEREHFAFGGQEKMMLTKFRKTLCPPWFLLYAVSFNPAIELAHSYSS
jgi:hypothetical protein